MITNSNNKNIEKWLPVLFATAMIASFFLPWVIWQGFPVSGYDLPGGFFFSLAETKFKLGNPLPQFDFAFLLFWLIPAGAILTIALVFLQKKWQTAAFITGALSVSLVAVFFLFTRKLIMLGVGNNVFAMMQPVAWLHALAAIGLILSVPVSHALLKKTVWILAGPVFVFISFLLMEKYVMSETFSDTADSKADYTVNATELIKEFLSNDSLANKKYNEKILIVNGRAGDIEFKSDSTTHIKYADSSGSYISFSLDKEEFEKVKNIKTGDPVSLKGSCSGSFYSDILGTTQISFKRSTFNNK